MHVPVVPPEHERRLDAGMPMSSSADFAAMSGAFLISSPTLASAMPPGSTSALRTVSPRPPKALHVVLKHTA
jgi:hypothetical protein